jgi:hypothetical protein
MGVWFIGSMAFTAMLAVAVLAMRSSSTIEDDQLVLRPL